jgi:Domain of unknown function (DUF4136)
MRLGYRRAGEKPMKPIFAAWAVLALAVSGCASTFKAQYDHDPEQDFSKYHKFAWISEHPMKIAETVNPPSPLLEGRIMKALEAGLAEKGFEKADDPADADIVISFTIGSRENIRVDSYPDMTFGYGMGYPAHWGWGASYYCCQTNTQVTHYNTGTLAVDIFDESERRPVWHGHASKSITDTDRKNVDATVKAAVDAILDGFPPKADDKKK